LNTSSLLRCCFCGLDATPDGYLELTLRTPWAPAQQSFGAHRAHLAKRLAPGFVIELEPMDDSPAEPAWARVGIRVEGTRLSGKDIANRLGRPNEARTNRIWAIDLADSSVPLDRQLDEAAAFLRLHQETLRALAAECEVTLLVSWTPRTPQDGLGLHPELIDLLAGVHGRVLLDTYLD
jgi:hypothetical protein